MKTGLDYYVVSACIGVEDISTGGEMKNMIMMMRGLISEVNESGDGDREKFKREALKGVVKLRESLDNIEEWCNA